MSVRRWIGASCLAVATLGAGAGLPAGTLGAAAPRDRVAAQLPTATPELLLDQGRRLFDAFQYEQAVPVFDKVVALLSAGGQVQKPELLAQAYELRARARFAQGDSSGAEQDFSALLALNPSVKLGPEISPRVVAVFDSVRRLTVGQVILSVTPPGEIQIDGRSYTLKAEPQPIDLPAGEHQLSATRLGYRPLAQKFTVTAGEVQPISVALERVSATLAVTSIPAGVEVLVDGTARGSTAPGTGETSAPLMLTDLQPGPHRLLLRRPCYKDLEHTITIERPDDLRTDPLRLTESVAKVKISPDDPTAVVFIDGVRRGSGPLELNNVCEGPHLIEVRGPKGRFIDRRDWKTGDAVTLAAELRSAFAIVGTTGVPAAAIERLRSNAERAMAPTPRVLIYVPADSDLENARRGEDVPAGWLSPEASVDAATGSRISREIRRDVGRRWAARLEAQGVAAIAGSADPNVVTLTILAAGSGEPDVVTVNLVDPASRARAADFLAASLPPLVRPSLDAAVVDVAGIQGAVVIRTGASAAKAGLAAGDVIVGAGGAPVTSVADLRARMAAVRGPSVDLPLDVKGAGGAARTVSGSVALAAETMPLRDASLPYNRALVDLRDAVKTAATPVETAAATLNLAIVHMRLGNWDDALAELKAVRLSEGPAVSAGTVAYLTGLCHEALGHAPEAQAAFTKAAASNEARISLEGPLVAPLAQRKLQGRR